MRYVRIRLDGLNLRIWDAVANGEQVVASTDDPEVPFDLIRQLVLGQGDTARPRKLDLVGARIAGKADLSVDTLVCPLYLTDCRMGELNLKQTKAPAVSLQGCTFPGLHGSQLQTKQSLTVEDCTVKGGVDLDGATINGGLSFRNTRIENPQGIALQADGLTVGQDLVCDGEFTACGKTSLVGAKVGGRFIAGGATFHRPGGEAIDATNLMVHQETSWNAGFSSVGEVLISGAHLQGQLDCTKATLSNPGGHALLAHRVTVDQDVCFTDGFRAEGKVSLVGARIHGSLRFTGGQLANKGRMALDLARVHVDQNMSCRNGFDVDGQVLLTDAVITGNLWCEGGRFHHPGDCAILADGMQVGRNVSFGEKTFANNTKPEGFTAEGRVALTNAVIGGDLDCGGGRFTNTGQKALTARNARIKLHLVLDRDTTVSGTVDLRDAQAGELDDRGFAWPDRVLLVGFTYTALRDFDIPVEIRIAWLNRNDRFAPQVYRQLAKVYRVAGYREKSEKVLIEEQWQRRRSANTRLGRAYALFKGAFMWATVNYGFSPIRVLFSLGLLEVAGGILFSALRDDIHPATAAHQGFQPWLYTLDLLLPVVNLHQRDLVVAHSAALWCSTGFTIIGWALGTALVVGVGSALKGAAR